MRIIFAGTPDFAAAHFEYLLENHSSLSEPLEIVAAYTQPDRKAGRGKKLRPPPVKSLALEHQIPVFQPTTLKSEEEQNRLKGFGADIMIVAAYGMLLPKAVLEIPRLGCINVHASLLPRWRGAAPIERAIVAGDTKSGVTIMQMDVGLDTGDMLLKASCPISESETGDSLHDKLVRLGQPALLESLNQFIERSITAEKQDDSQSCYAPKLNKAEGQIDWREPAGLIERKIRAFTSSLASYSVLNGERLRIVEARVESDITPTSKHSPGEIIAADKNHLLVVCGDQEQRSVLNIIQLQLPSKKAMSVSDILNGKPDLFSAGMQFELPAIEIGAC